MTKRCAIYTRKSTEEGLDQSFNSLDAQREACSAYVTSQKHEGWRSTSKSYDDGGYSGGSMDRPALRTLLEDVAKGVINVVVVYKIDRLTRSLMDFARIVEIFDKQKVSFVSVTQQFNTTTSMGRLTLNVLLSFAQFEREVTAERIRDKITASKMKGMWMGGPPPLGYDVKNRQLVINEGEARDVRKLFAAYLELGSVRQLKVWADREGIVTKRRVRNGRPCGGKPYWLGNLSELLANCIYIGQVKGRGTTYKGQHQGIVDLEVWQNVQERVRTKAIARKSPTNNRSSSLLIGKVFDETGERLSPASTSKRGRRYQYYVTRGLLIGQKSLARGWRIPAKTIENAVTQSTCHYLTTTALQNSRLTCAPELTLILQQMANGRALDRAGTVQILSVVSKVVVFDDRLSITLRPFLSTIGDDQQEHSDVTFAVPANLQRRGVEARLTIQSPGFTARYQDPKLVRTIALAWARFAEMQRSPKGTAKRILIGERLPDSELSRLLPLAFISPKLVESIVSGTQPPHLTSEALKRFPSMPLGWKQQELMLIDRA